ncbi:MAG: Chromate resistance protein ChrB [Candidatus Dormibacteria bacterium]
MSVTAKGYETYVTFLGTVMSTPTRFVTFVYRMPTKPTSARVAVWRQLKKMGAVYLQQSVCVFPESPSVRRELQPILKKLESSGGSFHLLSLGRLSAQEREKLISEFREQAAKHFQEIIENCEVNFQKEIEFETFRKNFTYEEAEEIRIEFEKIVNWYERVSLRDWFGAPNREDAREWLSRCERLLEEFEERVFEERAKAERLDTDSDTSHSRTTRRRRLRAVPGGHAFGA